MPEHDGLPESVHRLVNPWVYVLTPKEAGAYKPQDFPPLLDMLATIVTPSKNSRGGGKDASTRSILDVKALDLLMHIQDVVRGWLREWSIRSDELRADVLTFHERLETLWRTAQIAESEYLRLRGYLDRWAGQIWDLVEPPLQIVLRDATCPVCDRAKWINENEEWVDNLLVSYRDGGDVQAECRWRSCTGLWVGQRALRELGFHIGATSDEEALREMGAEV
jgi:hypothetical protein